MEKKHLNTENANYSYGSLQKILKTGLKKLDLDNYKDILILGMGGGSVLKTLRKKFLYKNNIVAVEIDPVMIQIAKEEFGISQANNLEIICDDATHFISANKKQYDLIIIDVFIDTKIPSPFFEIDFWQDVVKAGKSKGSILFNADLDEANQHHILNIASFLYKNKFEIEKMENVNQTNTLLIARR